MCKDFPRGSLGEEPPLARDDGKLKNVRGKCQRYFLNTSAPQLPEATKACHMHKYQSNAIKKSIIRGKEKISSYLSIYIVWKSLVKCT